MRIGGIRLNYFTFTVRIYLHKDFTEFLAELSLLREHPWLDPVGTCFSGELEATLQTQRWQRTSILCPAPELL